MSLGELIDLADRASDAVHRATAKWQPGMSGMVGATRCPGCGVVGALHFQRDAGGLIEYRCETSGCVVQRLRETMIETLAGVPGA